MCAANCMRANALGRPKVHAWPLLVPRAGKVPVTKTKAIYQSLYGADLVLGSKELSVDAKRG
jgi:hypothetical protein